MSTYNWLKQGRGIDVWSCALYTKDWALFSFSSPYYCQPSLFQKTPPQSKSLLWYSCHRWLSSHFCRSHEMTCTIMPADCFMSSHIHPKQCWMDHWVLHQQSWWSSCVRHCCLYSPKNQILIKHYKILQLKSAVIARINLTKFVSLSCWPCICTELPCHSPLTWVYCL